jgi:hypothetical protein
MGIHARWEQPTLVPVGAAVVCVKMANEEGRDLKTVLRGQEMRRARRSVSQRPNSAQGALFSDGP